AALTAEERAGDPAVRVHALFDVDGQGEEVEVLLRALAGRRRRQQHRLVVQVCADASCGLLGDASGLEADCVCAEAPVVDMGDGGLGVQTHGVSVLPPRTSNAPAAVWLRPRIRRIGPDAEWPATCAARLRCTS